MLNLTSLNQRVNALTAKINNIVPPTSSNLADVLINGNSAGATDIDMNNKEIINVATIEVIAPAIDQKNTITNRGIEVIKISNQHQYMFLGETTLRFFDEPTEANLTSYGKTQMEISNLAGTSAVTVNDSSITFLDPLTNGYSKLDINSLDFADATGTVVNTVTQTGMAVTGAGTISATGGLTIPSAVDFTNALAPTCLANPIDPLALCNKQYVDSQAALTAYQLYFNYTVPYTVPSGATYSELSPVQIIIPTEINWTTNSTTPVLLAGFFNSLINLNIPTSIPAGVWTLLLYAHVHITAGRDREAFFYELYGTTALGAENLIYTSPRSSLLNIVSPSIGSISVQGTISLTSLVGFTGLGIKLYIVANVGTTTTGSIFFQKADAYSSVLTSFASVQSPDLLNLNNTWTGANDFTSTLTGNLTGTTTNLAGGIASQIPYQSSVGVTSFIANGTAGQVLTSAGTAVPTWSTPSATTLANVLLAGNSAGATDINMNSKSINSALSISSTTFTGALTGNASTATNLSGGLGGQIPYQSAVNTTALLANGTLGQVLTSAGGTSAPTWTTSGSGATINITDTNTSATYYPTFVDSAGSGKTLRADIGTTPFSINPNTSDLRFGTSLKLDATNLNVAVGNNAGLTTQGANTVAIGNNAGNFKQGAGSISIGNSSGKGTSGTDFQGANSVAIGNTSGQTTQGINSVAIGNNAGNDRQLNYSVAIGSQAGATQQSFGGTAAVAVGNAAGNDRQGSGAVAVGNAAGQTTQGQNAIAIGTSAGNGSLAAQGASAIAIGNTAGFTTQGTSSVAIGNNAGNASQQTQAIAIGLNAGQNNQGTFCVSIGPNAATTSQGSSAIAIGGSAGQTSQGTNSVAIGTGAGSNSQITQAISIGNNAGQFNQQNSAIAIGALAGKGVISGQGANAIAIGNKAGESSQTAGSICLNATGVAVNPSVAGFFVSPIRVGTLGSLFTPPLPAGVLYYNAGEILITGP